MGSQTTSGMKMTLVMLTTNSTRYLAESREVVAKGEDDLTFPSQALERQIDCGARRFGLWLGRFSTSR